MWREQTYLHPRAKLGYFPAASDGNEVVIFDPEDHEREIDRLVFPRQPRHDRICIADFYRPLDSGERDVVALQVVTAGDEVTELMAQLERDGEFAEQLFVHGLGVQTAEGMAEWLHARVRGDLGDRPRPGPPLLVGLPRLPGPVRAREGLRAARRALDRHAPVRRLRGRARAVDRRDRRAPPAGRLLRHEKRLPAEGQGAGRHHRRLRPRSRRCSTRSRPTAPSRPSVERAPDAAGVD